MKNLVITEETARKAISMADAQLKPVLQELLGLSEPDNRPITERVKTFEDACAIIAPSSDLEPLLSYNGTDKEMIAARDWAKMSHIRKVLNEGWEPDWSNSNQYKYYPWFKMNSGSGLSSDDFDFDNSLSIVGSRLCFKSRELAEYAGQQFIDIYSQFMTL